MVKTIFYWGSMAVLAGVAVFVVANAAMISGEGRYMYASVSDVPERPVIIVLGAAVLRSGQLSAVFLDRANAAIVAYQMGKGKKILVSGDNGTPEHNEVDPARKYLISQGIPEADIYLDHAGFDTYSTMYRAHEIFGVTSAIIVTQSYHLPRSLFVAHMLGIDAVGYRSDNVHLLARNEMRESLARIKALWDVAVHRTPKYLGEKIPIV
ncbi:MAG TPA: ElyC/SanA/YdcF family protein [Candidatus Paceibacterota bacterium]|nr:ElyC/SanA/YdcF family protein [Candidatus Paceibacterota bacterium]